MNVPGPDLGGEKLASARKLGPSTVMSRELLVKAGLTYLLYNT